MTEVLYNPKIKPEHLARKAIVYLRQSSDKQVRQNKESQLLQYAVAERVRALGWKQVEIINSDLGSSAGRTYRRAARRHRDCRGWRGLHDCAGPLACLRPAGRLRACPQLGGTRRGRHRVPLERTRLPSSATN